MQQLPGPRLAGSWKITHYRWSLKYPRIPPPISFKHNMIPNCFYFKFNKSYYIIFIYIFYFYFCRAWWSRCAGVVGRKDYGWTAVLPTVEQLPGEHSIIIWNLTRPRRVCRCNVNSRGKVTESSQGSSISMQPIFQRPISGMYVSCIHAS